MKNPEIIKIGDIVSVEFIGEVKEMAKSFIDESIIYTITTKKPHGFCRVDITYITPVETPEMQSDIKE